MILCATRGGEESTITQTIATQLARAKGEPLALLYVADSSFLDKSASALLVDVEKELSKMGEFLMTMAAEKARREGVEVQTIVRCGILRDLLPLIARELNASTIVMGKPAGDRSRFNHSEMNTFIEHLAEQTGAEVILAG